MFFIYFQYVPFHTTAAAQPLDIRLHIGDTRYRDTAVWSVGVDRGWMAERRCRGRPQRNTRGAAAGKQLADALHSQLAHRLAVELPCSKRQAVAGRSKTERLSKQYVSCCAPALGAQHARSPPAFTFTAPLPPPRRVPLV